MYGLGPDDQSRASRRTSTRGPRRTAFTVKFTKAASWDTEIRARVAGGNPPDVGLFPQPGLMCDLAKQKKLLAFDDATVKTDKADMVTGLRRGRHVCRRQGLRPAQRGQRQERPVDDAPAFKASRLTSTEDAGQDARPDRPAQGQGKMPWCIAAESGSATGWPITDWIEDLVLRLAGPDELRQVGHRGAEVQQPGDQAGVRVLPEDRLHRRQRPRWHQVDRRDELPDRRQRAVRQPAGLLPVQAGDVRRQQGRLPGRGASPSLDTDGRRCTVPAEEPRATTRSSVGGDIAAAFNNDANTLKLRNFIASKENGIKPARPAAFSPHKSADVSLLPEQDAPDHREGVLYKATAARFDGSDLMPAKVGAGTFWTEPVKWISGQQDLDTTLNNIDASFPKASS